MQTRSLRLDAAAVKVLAHPLRSRLLSALRRGGPATATALAAELKTNTGATSYHLRKLEAVGLVADTGRGEGRRRLWTAASDSHGWLASDFAQDDDASLALNWLMRHYLMELVSRYQGWLDVEDTWPAEWRDATSLDDEILDLTVDQLRSLREELAAVIERYRVAGPDEPAGSHPVAVHHVAYPRSMQRDS